MLRLEQELIRKNFINLQTRNKIFSYGKKSNETLQVELEKQNNRYKFSFPMSDNSTHYAAYFIDKKKLDNYMNHIIINYL